MPLPTSMLGSLEHRTPAGIVLGVFPSTGAAFGVELQRSSQATTGSTSWVAVFLDATSQAYRYTALLPLSTRRFYFRARHVGLGYTAGAFTGIVSGKPVKLPLASRDTFISDQLNFQGSIMPTPVSGIFSYNTNSGLSFAAIAWNWTARTIYRPDGSTISIPASSIITAPAAPTLGQTAGGALGARTRFVRIAYIKNASATSHRLYSVSAESSLAILANNLLTITSPTNPGGYDGWCALIGTLTNTEFTQGAGNVTVINFGTNYLEPVGGATTAGTTPYAANWIGSVVEGYLGFSTTYYYYPFWDLSFAAMQADSIGVVMSSDSPGTAATIAQAQGQVTDGRIALSLTADSAAIIGYIKATTVAASGTGTGSGGGKF